MQYKRGSNVAESSFSRFFPKNPKLTFEVLTFIQNKILKYFLQQINWNQKAARNRDEFKILQFLQFSKREKICNMRFIISSLDNTYFFVEVSVAEREIFNDLIKIDREKQVDFFLILVQFMHSNPI